MKTQVKVDWQNRIVTVVGKNKRGVFIGRAKCSPKDKFSLYLGKDIATKRMEIQYSNAKIKNYRKRIKQLEKELVFFRKLLNKEKVNRFHLITDLEFILSQVEEKGE